MKLIHLSDLHLGKRVNEFNMLEDQAYILTKILNEWADQGINTEEKARASILEWKRRKERTNTEKSAKSRETQYEPPAIEGGFY